MSTPLGKAKALHYELRLPGNNHWGTCEPRLYLFLPAFAFSVRFAAVRLPVGKFFLLFSPLCWFFIGFRTAFRLHSSALSALENSKLTFSIL